jgi:hypothetical protein
MQDAELFLSLAEIAGVFVGFGALIAIRSGGTGDVIEVSMVGMVAWFGIQVVVAAITPVVVSRFGVDGHELWLACSLVVLALWWIGDEVVSRISPERRALKAALPMAVRWRQELFGACFWVPMNIALVIVALGLLPGQEPALYLAAVVLLLFMDAFMLLMIVTSAIRPPTVATTAPPPAQ